MSRDQVFSWLKDNDFAQAHVHFSGGGDEGGVEQIELKNADGNTVRDMREWYDNERWNPETGKYEQTSEPTTEQRINKELCRPVYARYGSFAGEFYVSGTVVWDVAKRSVSMDGRESVASYNDFEEDV